MTRRKPVLLPFERPTPDGGSWTITLGPSRSTVTLRLEFPSDVPRPHLIIECDGRPVPIQWTGPEVEPPSLVKLALLTQQRERGPA
jgi:hypothetical protein